MIREVAGDILLSRARVIAHGVAPNDDFSQGLALSLREQWPAMYKDFRHYCRLDHPQPGTLWVWAGPDGRRIVNLFTQAPAYEHGSRPGRATLENVNHALRALHKLAAGERYPSLAITRLATGVGALDWAEVRPVLMKHLEGLEMPVMVYATYHPGMAAQENL